MFGVYKKNRSGQSGFFMVFFLFYTTGTTTDEKGLSCIAVENEEAI